MGLPPRKDSISSGDSLRYQRLMQLTSKLQRSPSTPETPATPDGAAGVAAAGNNAENAIPSSPPPPSAAAMAASAKNAALACAASLGATPTAPSAIKSAAPAIKATAPRAAASARVHSVSVSSSQLARERVKAARRNDLVNLNKLKTQQGMAAFVKQQRMRAYANAQRQHNHLGGVGSAPGPNYVQRAEFSTQTDELSEWSKKMLARDEESLEHLAEADLAYLEMVRTKAGLHHQTAGAC